MRTNVVPSGVVLRFVLLAAGLGVAQAQPAPQPPRPAAETVAEAPQRTAPRQALPEPTPVRELPLWQSGFQNEEQLRNEMLSHGSWGGG